MTTANSSTPHEVVTAALLVIGDEILSGRTKDKNIGYIAEYLTAVGIDLMEVRVVGDEEASIVDALNALRHRYTYVFTTGGIGPTHDDITADCVAKAFGVPIDVDPRALAILQERLRATGAEMNDARLRMTRIPKGADLVINKVSGAPGIWIGNVIVMAGIPFATAGSTNVLHVVRLVGDELERQRLGRRPAHHVGKLSLRRRPKNRRGGLGHAGKAMGRARAAAGRETAAGRDGHAGGRARHSDGAAGRPCRD